MSNSFGSQGTVQVFTEDSSSGTTVSVKSIAGAALVTDGQGIARTRFVDVVSATAAGTAPTLAGTGTITFVSGVKAVVVESATLISGTVAVVLNNFTVRYAVDAANDAAAAILLPTAFPSHGATTELGQTGSFNLLPVSTTNAAGSAWLAQLILPAPFPIDISEDGILRLDFAHNIATTVTIRLGIRTLEAV